MGGCSLTDRDADGMSSRIISLRIIGPATKWSSGGTIDLRSPGVKESISFRFEKRFFRSAGDGVAKMCALTSTSLRRRPSPPST